MNGLSPLSVASYLALTFVELWFALLAHELGHAAVGLTRTEGLVRVRVGRSPGLWRARLGRLSLELHPFPARTEPDGIARTHAHFGQASALLYTLAGPAAGCSAAVLLILAGLRAGSEPLAVIGGLVFVSEVSNLLPSTRHGTGSDGARLLELFRAKRADHAPHPLADVE